MPRLYQNPLTMKTAKRRTESLEEIVFRHRNRSYGAYQLRRQYRRTIIVALIITFFVTSAIITYPLVTAMYFKPKVEIDDERIITIKMDKPPEEKPDPTPPPPPDPEKLIKQVKFVAPVIVDSAGDDSFGKQDLLAETSNTDPPDDDPGIVIEEDKPQVIEQPEEKRIHTNVQEMPEFPGGEMIMYKYFSEAINYPDEAKEIGVQGRVFINFVVEPDGAVTNGKLLRGIGGGCDEEAIRVVKSMPKWTPGKQNGIPVRVSFNLPIKFTLQ